MKKRTNYIAFLLISLIVIGCQTKNPYDNSTPEKFIFSLGQISTQPKEENPIPFFYIKEDASSITQYDESGQKSIDAFQAFKVAIRRNFPDKVEAETDKEITLHGDPKLYSTLEFRLSASLIKLQLQASSPSDYEFISASKPNDEGIINITYKMLGNESKVEVIKEDGQYMMFLPERSLTQINRVADFFTKAEAFFSNAVTEIENQEVTSENFVVKANDWNSKYMEVVNMLK